MKRTVVTFAALVVLAGCGGGSSAPSYASPQAMASKLGCTHQSAQTELIAREAVDCSYDGGSVEIVSFNDNAGRDQWLRIAKGFGGVYVVGNRWLVNADSTPMAQKVQKVLGGSIG